MIPSNPSAPVIEACSLSPSGKHTVIICAAGPKKMLYAMDPLTTEFTQIAEIEYGTPFVWSVLETKVATVVSNGTENSTVIGINVQTRQVTRRDFPALISGVEWITDDHMTCLFKWSRMHRLRKTIKELIDLNIGKIIVNSGWTLPRSYVFDQHSKVFCSTFHNECPYYAVIASPNGTDYDFIAGASFDGKVPKKDVAASPGLSISSQRRKVLYLRKRSPLSEALGQSASTVVQLACFDTESLEIIAINEVDPITNFGWWWQWSDEQSQYQEVILYVVRCATNQWAVKTVTVKGSSPQTLFTTETEISSLAGCTNRSSLFYVSEGTLHVADLNHDGSFEQTTLTI